MNNQKNNGDNSMGKSIKSGRILPGIILVFLGTAFLLNNYGFTNFDIGKLWPLFIIIPGLFIILGKK